MGILEVELCCIRHYLNFSGEQSRANKFLKIDYVIFYHVPDLIQVLKVYFALLE